MDSKGWNKLAVLVSVVVPALVLDLSPETENDDEDEKMEELVGDEGFEPPTYCV